MNATLSGIIALSMWSALAALVVLSGDVPPLQLAAMSIFIGFLTLTARQIVLGQDIKSYWRQPFYKYLFVCFGVGGYTGIIYMAFRNAPPFEANALNYLWPVFLVLMTAIINKTRLGAIQAIGIAVGCAGMVTLFLPREGLEFFSNFQLGHGLAILAALLWAVYSTMTKNIDFPQGFMAPVFLIMAVLFTGLHVIFEQTIWPQGWEWLAVAVLGSFRVSYSFWDYGMKKGNVVVLASLSYFVPLASMGILVAIGAGAQELLSGLAAALIVGGCLIVNGDQIIQRIRQGRVLP